MGGGPAGESARLAALDACAIVGTPREATFDNMVFTVAQILRLGTVAIVMVTRDGGWVKSMVGPSEAGVWQAMPLMRHVAESGELTVVSDMLADQRCTQARSRREEDGSDLAFRFCVAAPLLGPDANVVGCLCGLAPNVRFLTDGQVSSMVVLARQVSELIQLRVPGLDLTLVA